ncbi:MAG: UvrD-helicase domain-containing protein [Anaerolineae bacterium]|nr:UvrD-helicase domain-containing protein [Anaerolineae bacterium]
MTWFITHKPSYDTDFVELSKALQKQATQAHTELAQYPTTPRGNTIKPLRGWENVWRYRLGDHRLIYSVVPEQQVVQLLAIGPRGDIYRRFKYDPDAEEGTDVAFSPELAAGLEPTRHVPEWMAHPEWFRPPETSTLLPRKLPPGLLSRWRIPQTHHAALMRCRTEDDLLQSDLPDAVLGRVMDGLWPPEVEQIARQPDQVLFQAEDLERYAEGTLSGFLLRLDEDQRRFTHWALSGPTLVKGGPGSGKSTVALYRARALVEHALAERGQVPELLFTTFTNALTNFSDSLLRQLLEDVLNLRGGPLPPSIQVTTVDRVAMRIARGNGPRLNMAQDEHRTEALHYARSAHIPGRAGELEGLLVNVALQNLRDEYLLEEFEWVMEGQDCRSEQDYLDANRAGRAIPFHASLRSAVWKLYTAYRQYLQDRGICTWGRMRQLALDRVRSGAFAGRWEHVIVDEAQDLTPLALALCVELCAHPSGLFLTADANQSLYNRGFRWRNVHDQLRVTGRTRILRRNYRSTRQIAHAAAELLVDMDGADAEAMEQAFVHSGPPPAIYAADGAADQARWLVGQIWEAARDLHLPVNAAAVFVPTNRLGQALAALLTRQGLPTRFVTSREVQLEERSVKVMTLHAAKGLEFPIVAVAHVEADRLPRETAATDAQDVREHTDHQRRLFYVGCSRAMRYLFVAHDRSLPSPFLRMLSDERWLRVARR